MKNLLFILGSALLLTSCAGVKVADTYTATGATNPRAIYIRPFAVDKFTGRHGATGGRPIRASLAPHLFADALRTELGKIAPAMVIAENEMPERGWIVEGEIELTDAGQPLVRATGVPALGRSRVRIHVRVIDAGSHRHIARVDDKDADAVASTNRGVESSEGEVVYDFDLKGGSRLNGVIGSLHASGLGYATPFDYKNAAERVMLALSVDPYNLGQRFSPALN